MLDLQQIVGRGRGQSQFPSLPGYSEPQVGKVTLISNGDEALSNEYQYKKMAMNHLTMILFKNFCESVDLKNKRICLDGSYGLFLTCG
jgi:hypothetical protein